MNEYMLIYRGGDPDWAENTSPEEMQAAIDRWGAWMDGLQAQNKLVSGGAPLHYSGKRLNKDGIITDIAAAEFKELVSGYSVIAAKDFDEAISITKSCPIFEYPGTEAEVREVKKMDKPTAK